MDQAPRPDINLVRRQRQRAVAANIQCAMARAGRRLERPPSQEEIAQELRLTLREYRDQLTEVKDVTIGRLQCTSEADGGGWPRYMPDLEGTSSVAFTWKEFESILAQAIVELPYAEKTVLSLQYSENLTSNEIAQVVNCDLPCVFQLRSQAILRIRCFIETYAVRPDSLGGSL